MTEYENLVTYRNSQKPKYMEYFRMLLDYPVSMAAVTDSILFAFDVNNASGVNLDTIGDLVGISRLLPFVPTVGSREMNDDEYRLMIKLKIARNAWDGRNEPILGIYRNIFPEMNITYKDNQDMTVSLTAQGVFDYREAEILTVSGLILVPAGVGFNVTCYGGETTIKLYATVAQHGTTIIDRVVVYENDQPVDLHTWLDLKEKLWGDVKKHKWGDFIVEE